jgi:hypothetical protein
MKKFFGFMVAGMLVMGLAGCSTAPAAGPSSGTAPASAGSSSAAASVPARQERAVQGSAPDFVKQAIKNSPEDSLVAAGTSRLRDMGLAKQRAEVLARGEIARQLQTLSSSMIRDYAAASEADPSAELSITEALNTALARQTLVGARIVDYDVIDGTTWVIVEMPKTAQKTVINQAASAAKLSPAWSASLDAEERMEAAFTKNKLGDVPVASE